MEANCRRGLDIADRCWRSFIRNGLARTEGFRVLPEREDRQGGLVRLVSMPSYVLVTSAYNHQTLCKLEITLEGARKIWEQPFPSKVCSPVIHNGHIYFAWQRMRCLDFETGEQKWEGGTFSDAGSCIVTSDNRIIVWGGRGRLALVDTADRSPATYHELTSIDNVFSTDVWPHVVLANGSLFCKDRDGNIACFESSRPAPDTLRGQD